MDEVSQELDELKEFSRTWESLKLFEWLIHDGEAPSIKANKTPLVVLAESTTAILADRMKTYILQS